MRKFLLVVLIVMALAMNVYGIIKDCMVEDVMEIDHISETTTTVYVE